MSFYHFKTPEDFKEANGYEINGYWYPRVTKIVEIKAKPALYRYYAAAASFAEATAQTKKSAEEGTLVHETLEKILVGESPTIDDSILPAITACIEFLDRNNIQVDPDHVERRVLNLDHGYAGTIDALALIGGKFGVLDIKTSMDFYRDYNLQTAAYVDALVKDPSVADPQTRWILRVDQIKNCRNCVSTLRSKGGREKIRKPYPLSPGTKICPNGEHEWGPLTGVTEIQESPYWKEDFEAFLAATKLWEWENYYWLQRVGYLK